MKITAIRPILVDDGRVYTFVKVETDSGLYGVGEAGLGRRGPAMASVIDSLAHELVGQDPFRIEHHWQVMFRGGFFPGGVVQSAAVSAIDIALWDLKGKALGVPVYELLGGRCRDRVDCYPHIGGASVDELVAAARAKVDAGWRYVRWGLSDAGGGEAVFEPQRAVRGAVEQVHAVRAALGNDIGICLDVHTRLDPPAAIQLCHDVADAKPFFIEDPLRSENPASLRLLRQQTRVPLAVGEQFDSKWAFRQVIEEDLLDYCRLDLSICGGLSEGRKIAGWCETHYVHLAPHNPLGPVTTAASLHLCLASPLVGVCELAREPGTVMSDVFPRQVPFADGALQIPDAPGLGVEFDEDAAAARAPRDPSASPARGFRRADGSWHNW